MTPKQNLRNSSPSTPPTMAHSSVEDEQQKVGLAGLAVLALCSGCAYSACIVWPAQRDMPLRDAVQLAASSIFMGPGLSLLICIWRQVWHRLHSREDMAANKADSVTATELQDCIQNTLEQAVLAAIVYAAFGACMPLQWIRVVPIASFFFLLGRILFVRNIYKGASRRGLGFILSHLPSTLMSAAVVVRILYNGLFGL